MKSLKTEVLCHGKTESHLWHTAPHLQLVPEQFLKGPKSDTQFLHMPPTFELITTKVNLEGIVIRGDGVKLTVHVEEVFQNPLLGPGIG